MLCAVQTSIDKDKRTAVTSATVQQEAKVTSALSTAQAMLVSLGAKRLCTPSGMQTSLCRLLRVVLGGRIDKPVCGAGETLQHPLPSHNGPL